MERRKINRVPSAIFCSDLHLREDTPACWIGDFQLEQWSALSFIKNLQKEYKIPVFIARDIFHMWKASPWLLSMTMQHFPEQVFCVAGQHDLPQHNLGLIEKSGLFTLVKAGYVTLLEECNWGQEPKNGSYYFEEYDCHLLVWHHLTYMSKPFPGASGGMAEGVLRKYNKFPIILCGDNHQSFSVEYKGRLLVNPGNITRQTADQADFQPRVALWYAETNTIEWVNLPKQEGVISREHIEIKQERDKRIDTFIDQLNGDWSAGTSFEDNIEQFKNSNDIQPDVMDIVYKAMEDGTD